jgi:hypothetical protein
MVSITTKTVVWVGNNNFDKSKLVIRRFSNETKIFAYKEVTDFTHKNDCNTLTTTKKQNTLFIAKLNFLLTHNKHLITFENHMC